MSGIQVHRDNVKVVYRGRRIKMKVTAEQKGHSWVVDLGLLSSTNVITVLN